jgi:hypothetical protein
MEDLQQDHLTSLDLEIVDQVRQRLNESTKWSKFISIIMFIASALILLFGIVGGAVLTGVFRKIAGGYNVLGELSGGLFIVIIVFVAVLIAVIYYFLYDYSVKVKYALISESTASLNAGLKSLKLFFMLTTIIAVLTLLNQLYKLINS